MHYLRQRDHHPTVCSSRGLFAALVFVLSGSVLFIGKLATYDAPCLFLIAVALAISLTRKSVLSGAGRWSLGFSGHHQVRRNGFAPFVIALSTVNTGFGSRRELLRGVARVCVISACTATLLLGAYHLWGASLAKGLSLPRLVEEPSTFSPPAHSSGRQVQTSDYWPSSQSPVLSHSPLGDGYEAR